MGGIYFDPNGHPYVWRFSFPKAIQDRLVSAAHPTGDLTINDLEHASALCQVMVMADNHDVRYATTVSYTHLTLPTIYSV